MIEDTAKTKNLKSSNPTIKIASDKEIQKISKKLLQETRIYILLLLNDSLYHQKRKSSKYFYLLLFLMFKKERRGKTFASGLPKKGNEKGNFMQ